MFSFDLEDVSEEDVEDSNKYDKWSLAHSIDWRDGANITGSTSEKADKFGLHMNRNDLGGFLPFEAEDNLSDLESHYDVKEEEYQRRENRIRSTSNLWSQSHERSNSGSSFERLVDSIDSDEEELKQHNLEQDYVSNKFSGFHASKGYGSSSSISTIEKDFRTANNDAVSASSYKEQGSGISQLVKSALTFLTPSDGSISTKRSKEQLDYKQVSADKSDFILHRVIGKGAYGKVFLVEKTSSFDSGRFYAMKVLRKAELKMVEVGDTAIDINKNANMKDADEYKRNHKHNLSAKTERLVLEQVRHPFIVRLYYAFQTEHKLYLILDYLAGGELFTYLARQGMFLEDEAKLYVAELILALGHLHEYGIIYRDLKPENIMLDREGHVKLTDFGLSKMVEKWNHDSRLDADGDFAETVPPRSTSPRASTVCGTVEYMAPEVLAAGYDKSHSSSGNNQNDKQQYDKNVDWWSLGAVVFDMLTGRPPYQSNNRKKLMLMIQQSKPRIPNYLSTDVRNFLARLLNKNPAKRLGHRMDAEDLKRHAWFTGPKSASRSSKSAKVDKDTPITMGKETVDWEKVFNRLYDPPIKPQFHSEDDVRNFHESFTALPVVDTPKQIVNVESSVLNPRNRGSLFQESNSNVMKHTEQISDEQILEEEDLEKLTTSAKGLAISTTSGNTTHSGSNPSQDIFHGFSFVSSFVHDNMKQFENRLKSETLIENTKELEDTGGNSLEKVATYSPPGNN